MDRGWHRTIGWLVAVLAVGLAPSALAAPLPPDPGRIAATQLSDLDQEGVALRSVVTEGDGLTVCLDVSRDTLAADGWLGIETVTELVRRRLVTVAWRSLSIEAWDEALGACRPLSDFAPRTVLSQEGLEPSSPLAGIPLPVPVAPSHTSSVLSDSAAAYPASLAGKTVYLSAGHGWNWTGSSWRTQRPVYQGFIEDHNNAEVVTQYLIPFLENAGATVVYARERDWSIARAIMDNDGGAPAYTETGSWVPGASGPGYAGGSYRYAITDPSGALTARATWTLPVPAEGRYAVYAWVYPGDNRVRDAHYTVYHAGGNTEIILDQTVDPRTWRYLGTFSFYAGMASVSVDNRTTDPSTLRAVIADAIRLGGGAFDSLDLIPLKAPGTSLPRSAPYEPWWESGSFYWAQWSGLNPTDASLVPYLNDIVARPIYARWYEREGDEDGVFISWHTNGSDGSARGTVSYVHNGETLPLTEGSRALQAAVHTELVSDIRAGWDPTWADLNQRSLNLGELRMLYDEDVSYASIPGVLLEIAFHDNTEDALALKDPGFARLTARAVYQGIVRYYEGRDFVNLTYAPEPPRQLRVQNIGSGQLRVSWSPPVVDGIGGEAATGYRVATSPDGFAWRYVVETTATTAVLSGLSPLETVYVRVTATNAGGESFPTEVIGARVGEARLLLVNGYDRLDRLGLVREVDPVEGANLRMWVDRINSGAYIIHHGDAVPAGYAWDSASNEAVQTGVVALQAYDLLDWILGEESSAVDGSLNSTEQSLVSAYLAAGGALLVSGSEVAWHLEALGGGVDFLHSQLRTDYVADDAGTYTAVPVVGAAFSGLGELHFDAAGEYDADLPDVLSPLSGAQVALKYANPTSGGAAIQYAQGCQRLLVLGFPFETLRVAERGLAMAAALTFLDACYVDTTIIFPVDGSHVASLPAFLGTATGSSLTRVELQLRRLSDGYFWTGSAWTASLNRFSAQGTEVWSYAMPAMAWSESAYSLTASATGVISDDSPAESTFTLDRIAPSQPPAVIAPTAGVVLSGPLIPLTWTPVAQDSGSPLSYGIELDGNGFSRRFATSPAIVGLRNGAHSWRIRTEDAAGNVSAWSASHTFVVTGVKEAFLPLAMRRQ